MRYKIISIAIAGSIMGACASVRSVAVPTPAAPVGSPSADRPTEGEVRERPPRVRLPALTPRGFFLSDEKGGRFVTLGGRVLHRIPDARLAGNQGARGLWVQIGRHVFRLDVEDHELTSIPRRKARARIYNEGPQPHLAAPPGARYEGRVVGHWRFALPLGDELLAQWSGECENPTAYWISADGTARIITGEDDLGDAPTSQILGWAPNGDAFAFLNSGCGHQGDPPGVYRFQSPGDGHLVLETDPYGQAEMWTTGR